MAICVVSWPQPREDRGEGGHAGGHRHRHRERVVDEQRHRRDLGHVGAEVLPGHHVGAARLGVDLHDLEVREGDEEQDEDDAMVTGTTREKAATPMAMTSWISICSVA